MALAMLYYGSERVMANEIPEILVSGEAPNIHVKCNAGDCKWYAWAEDLEEAEEFGGEHQQWHEDGMPQ
jgi:hypothetical protein